MRLSSKILSIILSLFLGIAWGGVLVSASLAIFLNQGESLLSIIFDVILWSSPSLFFVLIIEYLINGFERTEEIKKQSIYLKSILEQLEKKS